jgi:phage-related protein
MQQQQKPAIFIDGSRRTLKDFPDLARWLAGNEINELQWGRMPDDWKPMSDIGPGALEIRIHEPHEYRVICVAKFAEAIYILHAFQKKTQKTPKKDLDIARKAYAEVKKIRQQAT